MLVLTVQGRISSELLLLTSPDATVVLISILESFKKGGTTGAALDHGTLTAVVTALNSKWLSDHA